MFFSPPRLVESLSEVQNFTNRIPGLNSFVGTLTSERGVWRSSQQVLSGLWSKMVKAQMCITKKYAQKKQPLRWLPEHLAGEVGSTCLELSEIKSLKAQKCVLGRPRLLGTLKLLNKIISGHRKKNKTKPWTLWKVHSVLFMQQELELFWPLSCKWEMSALSNWAAKLFAHLYWVLLCCSFAERPALRLWLRQWAQDTLQIRRNLTYSSKVENNNEQTVSSILIFHNHLKEKEKTCFIHFFFTICKA